MISVIYLKILQQNNQLSIHSKRIKTEKSRNKCMVVHFATILTFLYTSSFLKIKSQNFKNCSH